MESPPRLAELWTGRPQNSPQQRSERENREGGEEEEWRAEQTAASHSDLTGPCRPVGHTSPQRLTKDYRHCVVVCFFFLLLRFQSSPSSVTRLSVRLSSPLEDQKTVIVQRRGLCQLATLFRCGLFKRWMETCSLSFSLSLATEWFSRTKNEKENKSPRETWRESRPSDSRSHLAETRVRNTL